MKIQTLTQILTEMDAFGTQTDEYGAFAEIALDLHTPDKSLMECIEQAFDDHAGYTLTNKNKKFLYENL